jgi:UDP-3-O-[3-hydroxymyristoyl] N-acetylglucosamine deacetylase
MNSLEPNKAEDTASLTSSAQLILVVDDELAIRRAVEGVLQDEGFLTKSVDSGETAIEAVAEKRPNLILLDIWMSGLDGIETLRVIRERWPSVPVVMMSGHASISTAIEATRIGAADFIEKPIDLDRLLSAVRTVLRNSLKSHALNCASLDQSNDEGHHLQSQERFKINAVGEERKPVVTPLDWSFQPLKGRSRPQRTIASSAILYGQGLHSGQKSGLILEPLPANSGIHFVGVSGTRAVPAHVSYIHSTGFATTLRLEDTNAATIEHLMSALCAFGISNLLVKCNGEVPVMDGSAREFCNLLTNVGLIEQDGEWFDIAVDCTVEVGDESEYIRIEPADGFTIDYSLSYPSPVGEQRMVFSLQDDPAAFIEEISPARTFGFVRDITKLQKQGLALGGRFDNFVLMGESGPINSELRFSDELVRHKILDAIGDLYLLGRRLQGRVTARMTGHSDNAALIKEIYRLMSR